MVTLSVGALGATSLLEEHWALEREADALREALRRSQLDRDVERTVAQRRHDADVTEALSRGREAEARARTLARQSARIQAQLDRTIADRDRALGEAQQALDEADSARARAQAADSIARLAQTYAFEIDQRLTQVLDDNERLYHQGKALRDYASRHMPSVAPAKARADLDALRADLERAKSLSDRTREYEIGLACSGLRTFEASASGYECNLGTTLLAEVRHLRQDPVCVSFDATLDRPRGTTPRAAPSRRASRAGPSTQTVVLP